jgi:hypothetical protein
MNDVIENPNATQATALLLDKPPKAGVIVVMVRLAVPGPTGSSFSLIRIEVPNDLNPATYRNYRFRLDWPGLTVPYIFGAGTPYPASFDNNISVFYTIPNQVSSPPPVPGTQATLTCQNVSPPNVEQVPLTWQSI